jgi:serine/threonine protein kinase
MEPAAPAISTCPACGRALEETLGGGLGCIVCLLRVGIDGEDESGVSSAEDALAETLESDQHLGVYVIERCEDGSLYELGRGAMGVTYRAVDTTLQRKVALKIIKTGAATRSAEARERFMREARVAAALRHENIATVFQFGIREDTGQCFYAMELIEGETLEQRVRRTGPLDALTTINIALQVTAALVAAEERGLVHRDLKPGNLMLVDGGKKGDSSVKVIDFGVAKAISEKTNAMAITHGGFVGTPAFASPEQFTSAPIDVRSDIYSLGATLWFALTAKTPFGGQNIEEIRGAQQSNAPPIEQLKAAHVPHRLRALLRCMLAVEPAARPGTHELAARLRCCAPQTVARRRTRVAVAAAAVVILAASAFFSRMRSTLAAPEKSIAVLPFENLSRDPDNAYFADGIQDEILTRLSKMADLKVISRTSTQHYKSAPENLAEIAKQLGVAHILEGRVQKSGDAVRVNVQLIKAANDSHLWADTFDRKLTDMFSVESEVAKAIADQLRAHLTGQEEQVIAAKPTDNVEAYDAYLRGLAYSLKAVNISEKRCVWTRSSPLVGRCCRTWKRAATSHRVFNQRSLCVKRRGKPPKPRSLLSPISARPYWLRGNITTPA